MATSHQWSTGFCGCFDDCGICCMTCWCPCVQVGRNAEIITEGQTECASACCIWYLLQAFTGLGFVYSCGHRTLLRQKFGLPASPCHDCLAHCCCALCAFTQEARELKNRGMDPALGWQGGQKQFQAGVAPYQQPPMYK